MTDEKSRDAPGAVMPRRRRGFRPAGHRWRASPCSGLICENAGRASSASNGLSWLMETPLGPDSELAPCAEIKRKGVTIGDRHGQCVPRHRRRRTIALMLPADIPALIGRIPLFAHLNDAQRAALAGHTALDLPTRRPVPVQSRRSGRGAVFAAQAAAWAVFDGPTDLVRQVSADDCVGEVGLAQRRGRCATACAPCAIRNCCGWTATCSNI